MEMEVVMEATVEVMEATAHPKRLNLIIRSKRVMAKGVIARGVMVKTTWMTLIHMALLNMAPQNMALLNMGLLNMALQVKVMDLDRTVAADIADLLAMAMAYSGSSG